MPIQILTLGAGQDVGRSCFYVRFSNGRRILLDCGLHMANTDERFPDFQKIIAFAAKEKAPPTKPPTIPPELQMLGIRKAPTKRRSIYKASDRRQQPKTPQLANCDEFIDVVLVSHFHMDHSGALPYLTEFFQYRGPIVMTHPTMSIVPLMLNDFLKVQQNEEWGKGLPSYSERMIDEACALFKKIELMETLSFCGGEILVKCYYAGHVLGAAMFYIQCGDQSIVYTGDFNMTADRHLAGAWIQRLRPTLLITETTYASTIREVKKSREREFLEEILNTLERGGKVLIPTFALGRAQEICVLLEAFWRRCGLKFPIYFAAALSQKANFFYKTFLLWTNDNLRTTFLTQNHNLFEFDYVQPWDWSFQKSTEPMVVLASSGMIHAGSSLALFKDWCGNPNNTVIIPGFCMRSTIGGQILRGAREVSIYGRPYQVKCKVCSYSFSAHADYAGIMQLIEKVKPLRLMLVHGEKHVMQRFREREKGLLGLECYHPANGSVLSIDRSQVVFLPELKPPQIMYDTSPHSQSRKQQKKKGKYQPSVPERSRGDPFKHHKKEGEQRVMKMIMKQKK